MTSKEIKVSKWNDILSELPEGHSNKELFKNLTKAGSHLEKNNKDYVYLIEMDYGDYIIEKGSMFHISDYRVESNPFGKELNDFIHDIGYSHDPLGLVLSNQVDVFTENKSFGDNNADWYNIPLNVLNPGDFFGVFGFLDSIIDYDVESKVERDWYAVAGNISFEIAFPFHHGGVEDWIDEHYQLSARNKGNDISHYHHKIEFVKSFLNKKTTKVLYFPLHFFNDIPDDLKLVIENHLFKIGWDQSSGIREGLFQDTSIYDFLREQSSRKSENKDLRGLKHDKKFLAILINYLLGASKGMGNVLRPVIQEYHFMSELLNGFKNDEDVKLYFEDSKSFEPIPFTWERLSNDSPWGIVSFFHLPIIHQYTILSPTLLIKDLNKIFLSMKKNLSKFDLMGMDAIASIGGFYGSSSKNGIDENLNDYFSLDTKAKGATQFMNNNALLKQKICELQNGIKVDKINLNSRLFANLFLINYADEY